MSVLRNNMGQSRLDQCGWSSFDPALFFDEPGRVARRAGPATHDMIRDFSPGQAVLELCCGGGALSIYLAQSGFDVTAVDLSEKMLNQFQKQMAGCDETTRNRLNLVRADVCAFDLGRQFDFIILEDDGLGYLLNAEDQQACMGRISRHLAPDGRCLLTNMTPDLEKTASKAFEYDRETHILTRPHHWTSTDAGGQRTVIHQGFERRYLYECGQLQRLIHSVGLEVFKRWGDLNRAPFKDPATQEYVLLIQHA